MSLEKLQILAQIFGEYYRSNNEYLFFCPNCDHRKRKLSINLIKNTYKCWICDSFGRNIYYLINKFGTNLQKRDWQSFENSIKISEFDDLFKEKGQDQYEQKVQLPQEFISLANKNLPLLAKIPLRYLKRRGIIKDDILKWKMGFCEDGEFKNRIIIPSFNKEGYCNYFVARSYTNNKMKYKNPQVSKDIIFNELCIDWKKDLVLVEGVFDAIKASNAIPLLGSTLRETSTLFKKIIHNSLSIFLALDSDANNKTLKLINLLLQYNIELHKIDTTGYKDVGEMTKKEFIIRKNNAAHINHDNYLLHQASML